MNPEVVEAIGVLREKGALRENQAEELLRVAEGRLVSLRMELQTMLYAGVLLFVSGVGLFLKKNHDRIGPAAITALISLAAASCFVYALRHSPPFSWGSSPSPHLGVDYVALLGVLLAGSDLAYIETQFRFLGADWAYHLLALSLIALAAACRFDSRVVLSLALSSFAAWRGLSARYPLEAIFRGRAAELRANALVSAGIFLAAAVVAVRAKKKAHFEGVLATFGWLLLFGGLLSGVYQAETLWPLWTLAACAAAAAVILFAYRLRRVGDFAIAVLAAYLALLKPLAKATGEGQTLRYLVTLSSLGVLALLTAAYRRMRAAP